MNPPCLFVAVLLCFLAPANPIHAQRAEAWTGSLFHEPAGVMGMPRMQEALKGIEYGAALTLDLEAFHALRDNDADRFALTLPLPEGRATAGSNELNFQAERFFVHPAVLTVGLTGDKGLVEEAYIPRLQTFKLRLGEDVVGTLALMADHVMGSFHHDGQQYDFAQIDGTLYAVMDFNQRQDLTPFECAVEEREVERKEALGQRANNGGCVEVAVDIDNFTFGQFGNNMANATDWALAQMAGVEAIYTQELNGQWLLQASYVHIWQTTDPMASFVNDAGGMLDNFRFTWESTASLDAVQRDVTHLMSRRGNTGTGGIAYLDVVCFPQYAAGFSSYMLSGNEYDLNNYSWNLNVVGHELGHNFGSNHTHWCGWSEGPIDNCYEAEGDCTNDPQPQVGTMMSYCHAVAGGSVNLNFHPTVINEALIPTINSDGNCFTDCVEWTTSCDYYGCTDSAACNYDPLAVLDDSSCAFELDGCGVCGGGNESCSGCTDESACNYDAEATIDDGGCYHPPFGATCTCTYDASFDVNLSAGETASESVEAAGFVTGLEAILVFQDLPPDQSWANEMMVGLTAPDGTCLQYGGYNLSLNCPSAGLWPSNWNTSAQGTYTASVVFPEPIQGTGTWTITILNSWDSSNGASYETTLTFNGLCAGNFNNPGCTNADACNYDPTAVSDDGTCEFESCSCPGDLNGDNVVTVADLLVFLSDFGCVNMPCPGDANNNGLTNVEDLLVLLAAFDEPCP